MCTEFRLDLIVMSHRMLTILLIVATLLGPSVCCCTMKVASAESSAPACCCCEQDDAAKQCPDDSDGNGEHECPCRKHQSLRARLDDSMILQTSPSVKWIMELSDNCSPVLFWSDGVLPQGASVLPGRYSPAEAGRALLIAHGVNRC